MSIISDNDRQSLKDYVAELEALLEVIKADLSALDSGTSSQTLTNNLEHLGGKVTEAVSFLRDISQPNTKR